MRLRHISRNLAAAWGVLLFERLWRRFLPALLLVLAFAACCWLNVFALLPPVLRGILLALWAAAFIFAALFLCLLRLPSRREAAARLSRDSGLRFDELELEETAPAAGASAAARALWREHKKRLRRAMPPLRLNAPRPNIPLYDKYGLRAAVFLLFAVAFAYSLSGKSGRLADAFYFGPPVNAADLRIDAWVNPPEWTGRPPVYLSAGGAGGASAASARQNFSVPAGSLLVVRINDSGRGLARLRCAEAGGKAAPAAQRRSEAGSDYRLRLLRPAQCSLSSPLGAQAWSFAVEADKAPQITWAGAPERALNGVLKLRYKIYDDYGVKKAWAEITPLAENAAAPFYFARLNGQKQLLQSKNGSLTLWRGFAATGAAAERAADAGGLGAAAAENAGALAAAAALPVSAPLIPLPQINLTLPRFRQTGGEAGGAWRGGEARTEINLSKSAWAGAFVSLRLAAEDGAGQIAYSAPRRLVLPQQNFISPIARALSEQRRLLAESSAYAPRLAAALEAMLLWPEKTIPDKGAALALFSLRARLAQEEEQEAGSAREGATGTEDNAARSAREGATGTEDNAARRGAAPTGTEDNAARSAREGATGTEDNAAGSALLLPQAQGQKAVLTAEQKAQIAARDAGLRDIAAYMEAIAEGIDGGKLAAAEKRLKQASQALRDALRNGASEEEIARLMQNLRGAMDDYITMLAERGQSGQNSENTQMLGESDLEKKLKALEEAAKQGQRGTAEQMLSDFDALMKNLQVAQGGSGDARGGGKSGKQSQMQKQMDALSDIMRRQQQLLDDTHKKREEEARGEEGQSPDRDREARGGEGQSKDAPAQGGKDGAQERSALSGRQQNLQRDLQDVQRRMQEGGMAPQGGFGEAQRHMQESGEALREGDNSRAQGAQAEALQSLRDDAQKLMGQMRAALAAEDAARQKEQNGGAAAGNAARQSGKDGQDPLGRPSGTGQAGNAESLPEGEAPARARHILEEIRKRLGALTPKQEKDYLERLLNFE